jgi:protein-tyrosine-phosphatase
MGLTITRRLLFLSLAAAPTVSWAACATPRVLFVCPAGTVKSAVAREVLRARVAAERLDVTVASRGLNPEDHVSPALAAKLRADGLDPAREAARPLTARDVADADIVIAFDEAAGAAALHGARAWRTPSWNADYDTAKADLAMRMDGLVAELRARAETCP